MMIKLHCVLGLTACSVFAPFFIARQHSNADAR